MFIGLVWLVHCAVFGLLDMSIICKCLQFGRVGRVGLVWLGWSGWSGWSICAVFGCAVMSIFVVVYCLVGLVGLDAGVGMFVTLLDFVNSVN